MDRTIFAHRCDLISEVVDEAGGMDGNDVATKEDVLVQKELTEDDQDLVGVDNEAYDVTFWSERDGEIKPES
jgi:hypothetical protein